MSETIAIIGAGISGLTAARILSHRGHRVAIFEKSRGIGGRLSTRRTDHGSFDHGAPYIETKDPKFRALLTGLSNLSSVCPWEPAGKSSTDIWHVGQPGMSGLLRPLADQIRVHHSAEVQGLAPGQSGVDIAFSAPSENGERQVGVSNFDRAILAVPAPQAQRLLAQSGNRFDPIKSVVMEPCWTGLFSFGEPIEALQDICLTHQDDTIEWLGHNGSKPDRTTGNYVLHSTSIFSLVHLEDEKEAIIDQLFDQLNKATNSALPKPIYKSAHRWRYARTKTPLGQPFITNESGTISAIGDWCLGDKAEHGFESARQLTEHLKNISV